MGVGKEKECKYTTFCVRCIGYQRSSDLEQLTYEQHVTVYREKGFIKSV